MTRLLELEQAARLHRAEARWLDQCADRLRASRVRRRTARTDAATAAATTEVLR